MYKRSFLLETRSDFFSNLSQPIIIHEGEIPRNDGKSIPFVLELGLSVASLNDCSRWKDFVFEFVFDYLDKNPNAKNPMEAVKNKIMLEDSHWNWYAKASKYHTSENNWFFLKTAEGVQGVCLTYHPKDSVLQDSSIFYIEYLASAPWNRNSAFHDKIYSGVGIQMIKLIQLFFNKNFGYKYGFSLHSLPQAEGFYEKIGMNNFPNYDKSSLRFYEISKKNVMILLGEQDA
jgi:hypothetical protein